MSDYEDEREDVDLMDRRAYHNALERKRRGQMKESFNNLRDTIPQLAGEKASRCQVLNSATSYIETLRATTQEHRRDIDAIKKENFALEQQIKMLQMANAERAIAKPQRAAHYHAKPAAAAIQPVVIRIGWNGEPTTKLPRSTSEN
ncbi:protein max-like [Corticium candelabrum]|uniref:protein max-like n=1 Tax=Corticium candelabrum TaxID=121492 RepID=UPI002E259F04|nr:protein max-like [Corticium candelabrum]